MTLGGAGRRRGATAVVLLALALLAVTAPLTASAGTQCAWQRHAKRVVKHVKRHGKVKRVVRKPHYWTCNPVPAPETPVAPTPGTPVAPTPAPEAEPQPEPKANAVGVIANDNPNFSYTVLTEAEPHTGPLTVQLQNSGEDPHNLNIQTIGPGDAEGETIAALGNTEPGNQTTAVVELPPGEYRMFCSIGHHAELGMEARIVVK